jgi:hypothetical protein
MIWPCRIMTSPCCMSAACCLSIRPLARSRSNTSLFLAPIILATNARFSASLLTPPPPPPPLALPPPTPAPTGDPLPSYSAVCTCACVCCNVWCAGDWCCPARRAVGVAGGGATLTLTLLLTTMVEAEARSVGRRPAPLYTSPGYRTSRLVPSGPAHKPREPVLSVRLWSKNRSSL